MFDKKTLLFFTAYVLSSSVFAYNGVHRIFIHDSGQYVVTTGQGNSLTIVQTPQGSSDYQNFAGWSFQAVPGQEANEGHQFIAGGLCLSLKANSNAAMVACASSSIPDDQDLRLLQLTRDNPDSSLDHYLIKRATANLCMQGDISGNVQDSNIRTFKVVTCDPVSRAQQYSLPFFASSNGNGNGNSSGGGGSNCYSGTSSTGGNAYGGFNTAVPSPHCFDSTAQEQQIAVQLMNDLSSRYDLTGPQVAGILGNLMHESGLNSNINQGGTCGEPNSSQTPNYSAYGWAQWDAGNKTEFVNFAHQHSLDPASPAANYLFLTYELDNKDYGRSAINAVKSSSSLEDATQKFMQIYEGPLDPELNSRINNARTALQWYTGSGGTSGSSCSSSGSNSSSGSSSGSYNSSHGNPVNPNNAGACTSNTIPSNLQEIDSKYGAIIEKYIAGTGIPKLFIEAEIMQESGGNPMANGDNGHSRGLLQLNTGDSGFQQAYPNFHEPPVGDTSDPRYDPDTNIKIAILNDILPWYQKNNGNLWGTAIDYETGGERQNTVPGYPDQVLAHCAGN